MMITVALDIGGVCIALHMQECLTAFGFPPEMPLPDAMRQGLSLYACGKISTEQWLDSAFDFFQGKFTREQIAEIWNSMLGKPLPGMTENICGLSARGVNFVFFSDTNELHWTDLCRNLPFAHLVTDSILSFEAGCCKPSAGMYELFESRHGIPDFYFDDLPQNIEGGKKRGWNAIQFTSPEQFRTVLETALCR